MESRKNYIVPIIDLEKKKERSNHQNVFGDFDVENLVIKEPSSNKVVVSDIVYKYDDEEYNLFLDLPKRFSYGIQEIYPYESSDKKNCTGLQFSYFIDEPGKEESSNRIKGIFDYLVEETRDFVEDKNREDPDKLPETITSAIVSEGELVKPIYFVGANSETHRSYFKLDTTKTRNGLKVDTKVNGPLGKDSLDYLDLKAQIRPVVWVKGVYFNNITDAQYPVSLVLRAVQMKIEPEEQRCELVDIYDD